MGRRGNDGAISSSETIKVGCAVAGGLLTVAGDTGSVRCWINPAKAVAGDCVGLAALGLENPEDSCSIVPTCDRTGIAGVAAVEEASM